jgi:hypothetical protein
MATQNRGGKGPRAGADRRPGAPPRGVAAPDATANGDSASAGAGSAPRRPGQQQASPPRRLGQQQQSNAPRRLGQQPARPRSQGAQRRSQRARRGSNARWGWAAVAVVVVAALVVTLLKVTSSNSNSHGNSTSGVASGQTPAAAPASIVNQLTSTPMATQSAAGVGQQTTSPYATLKSYTPLTGTSSTGAKVPRVAFVGAEFCPYCAVDRYAVILAMSRLGTFHNLKVTTSGSTDGDIPTFSFLHSSYTSPYVAFTPYETEDRNHNNLQTPPKNILDLWTKDDTALGNSIGWPYMNFGGRYVLASFPSGMAGALNALDPASNSSGSGLSRSAIVAAVHDPSSSYGSIISSSEILSEANYVDAAVCLLDGGKPASVCQASGVKAAMAVIAKTAPSKV